MLYEVHRGQTTLKCPHKLGICCGDQGVICGERNIVNNSGLSLVQHGNKPFSRLKKEIRRAKRRPEIDLADNIKGNL